MHAGFSDCCTFNDKTKLVSTVQKKDSCQRGRNGSKRGFMSQRKMMTVLKPSIQAMAASVIRLRDVENLRRPTDWSRINKESGLINRINAVYINKLSFISTHDAVEVGVEAPNVMGGVAVGVDGGGRGGAPQRLQALLVPHVSSPGPTAVWGGQVQRRTALKRTERKFCLCSWQETWDSDSHFFYSFINLFLHTRAEIVLSFFFSNHHNKKKDWTWIHHRDISCVIQV